MEQPKQIKRVIGTAINKTCYVGLAATGRDADGNEFILIASDIAALRTLWIEIMPTTILDENGVQEVAVFHRKVVTE